MTFDQATAYLKGLQSRGMQMGLERMEHAASQLGHPECQFPAIHVAGTNGKGSTARMIAAMLTANGYRTGLYTSPMVTDITDMILIDGIPVSKERFAACVDIVAKSVPDGLSEYECLTSAVFLCFKKERVDIAVIECCLGGETDATNIIPAPLCAVFTPIDLDHTGILGTSIEEIAHVKSGIIKSGCDVVCSASMCPDALGVLFEKAASHGCTVHASTLHNLRSLNAGRTVFEYNDKVISLSLVGEHQIENAVTSLKVMEVLQKRGYHFNSEVSIKALEQVTMPCRQEIIQNEPLIMIDGAHNPHGVAALGRTLSSLNVTNGTLVIGMLADKDVHSCLELLSPFFSRVICCTPPNTTRAMKAENLAEIAAHYFRCVEIEPNPKVAFQKAKDNDDNSSIIIGGSFYTSAAVRQIAI